MKHVAVLRFFITFLALLSISLLSACGVAGVAIITPTPVTPTATIVTDTPAPTATPTIEPTATATTTPTRVPTAVLTSSTPIDLSAIHMVDTLNGWGIGKEIGQTTDLILETHDGGRTWVNVTPPHAFDAIGPSNKSAIGYFASINDAWVFYYNTDMTPLGSTSAVVWNTTNGGQTWVASQPLNQTNLQMAFFKPSDIDFPDNQHGWIMIHLDAGMMHDYVTIYATADGGQTWKRVVDPSQNSLPQSCYKNGMVFQNATDGWVAGDCGGVMAGVYLYKSTDGGQTWTMQSLPAPASTPDAFTSQNDACSAFTPQFVDANTGFMLIKCTDLSSSTPQNTAWTYITTNAGQDWTALSALPQAIGSLFFYNNSTGWFMGATNADPTQAKYQISVTTDGGKTWTSVIKPTWSGQMDFISADVGWIVATSGSGNTFARALVITADGGVSWQQIKPVLLTP